MSANACITDLAEVLRHPERLNNGTPDEFRELCASALQSQAVEIETLRASEAYLSGNLGLALDIEKELRDALESQAKRIAELTAEIGQKSELLEAYEGGLQEIANLAPDNGKLEVAAARLNRAVSIALTTLDCRSLQTKDTTNEQV